MRDTLRFGLSALGLDAGLAEPLTRFTELLLERNQVMNLTAITEPKDVATLHLLDSLQLVPFANLENQSIIDVGSGAGFPGVPLALARPQLSMTLLDSSGKRVDFLKEVCDCLKLQHVECVQGRAEEYVCQRRECFQIAVSRAVASLPVLCELCLPLVSMKGKFLALKSSHCDSEIEEAKAAISILGGEISSISDYRIPTTDVVHRIVCIEKIRHSPDQYPRRYAQIKKAPLGTAGTHKQ